MKKYIHLIIPLTLICFCYLIKDNQQDAIQLATYSLLALIFVEVCAIQKEGKQ